MNITRNFVVSSVTSEYARLVADFLSESGPAERRAVARGARWFFAATVGSPGVEEVGLLGALEVLYRDAAVIYDIGISGGDHEQAADTVRLGAGLLELRLGDDTAMAGLHPDEPYEAA